MVNSIIFGMEKQLMGRTTLLVILLGFISGNHATSAPRISTSKPGSYPVNNLHKRQKSEKLEALAPYIDLTEALNKQNGIEIKNSLKYTSRVYYSTDKMITELPDLSWVAETLNEYKIVSNNSSLCLMISFQVTNTNRSDIDWRHIKDILYALPNSTSNDGQERKGLQALREILCKVAVDLQITNQTDEYFVSQSYVRNVDISFVKYAKKLTNLIMGPGKRLPVGIIYNERQTTPSSELLLEQEIPFADFLIVNLEFFPITRMPLIYGQFESHLHRTLLQQTQQYINGSGAKVNLENIPVNLMVSWGKPEDNNLLLYTQSLISIYKKETKSSQESYLEIFQHFVGMMVRWGNGEIRIVSGANFDFREKVVTRLDQYYGKIEQLIPYLYLQEVDTTPCQLRQMLGLITGSFESLVVNEYTWSAMVHNENELTNQENSKCSSLVRPVQELDNVLLFASDGIGERWNETGGFFAKFISENLNVANVSLGTLVFSAYDVENSLRDKISRYSHPSIYEPQYANRNIGIKKFVQDWVGENMTKVGCLADITTSLRYQEPHSIINTAFSQCQSILMNSSLIVLQYRMPNLTDPTNSFSFDFSIGSAKRDLFNMLLAKRLVEKYWLEKEIIFQIVQERNQIDPSDVQGSSAKVPMCGADVKREMELQETILRWARLHGVNIIMTPAFDLEDPMNGFWMPPDEIGNESAFEPWQCK